MNDKRMILKLLLTLLSYGVFAWLLVHFVLVAVSFIMTVVLIVLGTHGKELLC